MLPKGAYDPKTTEAEMLKFWMENNFYKPEYESDKKNSTAYLGDNDVMAESVVSRQARYDTRETYTNILPPPNANGNLHLGHMSGYAYQDLMGRYQRMRGKKVLLLPGKDHAGIQTEVVFEKELEKKGKSKRDLGRETFYKACYKFCMDNAAIARKQEQNLGLAADYDRELFTLDPRVVNQVLTTFEDFYKDDLVYRDKRLINWCPRCYTALADIDTEYKDSKAKFFYFKYGFTEPDSDLIMIRDKFANKEVTWSYIGRQNSAEEETPFDMGEYKDLQINNSILKVLILGHHEFEIGQSYTTKAIGVLSKLNGNHRLVCVIDEDKATMKKDLENLFKFEITRAAGANVILFDEYKEDKFYNRGFVLGTVRPETKFGDTAIAVNPKDERYKDWVGKDVEVNSLNGPIKLKVIADNAVDIEFGAGALKVTPAHAKEDWDIATRHPEVLPEKQVIGFDGKLNHLTGKYKGMDVDEAREVILKDMKELGMLVYLQEDYENRNQVCERCKHRIEPLISYQWFLNTKPLKAKAKQLVEDGITKIMPDGKEAVYLNWMDDPEDWCITRQLWWGYRVPVWYKYQPEEFVTESGEVKEKIGEKVIETMEDYKEFMHVGQMAPDGIKLTIIRHGETELNKKGVFQGRIDEPLNEVGIKQAKELATRIKSSDYDLIVSSPLKRAYQTAQELGKQTGLEIVTDDRLMERSFGDLEGQNIDDAFKNQGVNKVYQLSMPNGESIEEVEARVREFIVDATSKYRGKRILLVTHVGVYRILLRELGGFSVEETRKLSIPNCSTFDLYINEGSEWHQDEDVLDTWFSSGQWPAVTLLANEGDFEKFYPTQVMETGWDILIFWVTRMMLLCPYKAEKSIINNQKLKINDEGVTPFKNVYLHGLVLDKNGVKMSKSKGNGIDPFEMMQKYGTDALRLSFVVGNKVGQNYRLYEEKIESFRNYCNKIWNVSKFTLMNLENAGFNPATIQSSELKFEADDNAMIEHMKEIIESSTRNMEKFNFGIVAQNLYESLWHTFADEYVEKIKQRTYTKDRDGNPINTSIEAQESRKSALWTLWYSLDTYLRLLHPFIPFITERIWAEVPKVEDESETLMYAKWPNND